MKLGIHNPFLRLHCRQKTVRGVPCVGILRTPLLIVHLVIVHPLIAHLLATFWLSSYLGH